MYKKVVIAFNYLLTTDIFLSIIMDYNQYKY